MAAIFQLSYLKHFKNSIFKDCFQYCFGRPKNIENNPYNLIS